MLWSESVRIETPEQIDFDLEVAGPGSRFVAQTIDWIFKWLILAGIAVIGLVLAGMLSGRQFDDWTEGSRYVLLAILAVVAFAVFFGYDIYFEGYGNGQTPGKRRAGIRVVRDTGGPIDVTAACIRNLIGLADFLPAFYVLGGFIMLLNDRAQRLGDLAAGTVVIRERRDEAPDEIEDDIKELAREQYTFLPEQLDRCEAGDLHVLYSFFARFSIMEFADRRRLTVKLCKIFLRKTGFEPTEPIEDKWERLGFLASLYRDLKARRQLN